MQYNTIQYNTIQYNTKSIHSAIFKKAQTTYKKEFLKLQGARAL